MKYDIEQNPNYYAVIPAEVRYCKGLEPNAKLLYGEISALCHQEGYCWANNRYFANLYDVDNRSIQNWLKSLQENNFIVVTNDGNEDNPKRLIYLAHAFQISVTRKNLHGGVKKSSYIIIHLIIHLIILLYHLPQKNGLRRSLLKRRRRRRIFSSSIV